MNVIVVSIAPKQTSPQTLESKWEITLLINHQESKYEFTRRTVPIGDRQGWVLSAEPDFYKMFQYNQKITQQIDRLIQQVARGELVDLPFEVGVFLSSEAVQTEIAHRWDEDSSSDRLLA
jgi:hypothetical protein